MDKQKKILHLIESDGMYGAENVVLGLALETNKDSQFAAVVGSIVQVADGNNALLSNARHSGIEAVEVLWRNKTIAIDVVHTARKLKKLKIDLIHSHGYKPSVVGFALRILTGIPIMATCHLRFVASEATLRLRSMVMIEEFLYRYFPRIVCVSTLIKTHLLRKGIKEDKLEVINNGVYLEDTVGIREETNKLRHEFGLTGDDVIILSVGRLTEQKAHRNIVRAAQILKEANTNVKILIAGEGELRPALEELIQKFGLGSMVRLLGFRDDIRALLNLADVFLLPSLDEGLPISMLEAMASKKAVIVTPVGAIPDVIENEKDGILIPVDDVRAIVDAVLRVSDDADLRRRLGACAYDKIKSDYSMAATYRRYKELYGGILNP